MMATLRLFLLTFVTMMFIVECSGADKSNRAGVFFKGSRQKITSRLRKIMNKQGSTDSDNELFTEVSKTPREESANKVTIVGAGRVGTAVAFSLISQYVTDEIVLLDLDEKLVKGEVQDLQHGIGFIKSPRVSGGTDYALSKNSKICIVTAGAKQLPGQSRLELVQRNLKAFKVIIPLLIHHSPDSIIIVVSNPVDIMTYIAWKLVNKPEATYRIIGSGTNLDSSRLRFLISQDLNISPESVHGYVIGEHGDSSVTAWSGVNVAGANLKSIPHTNEAMAKNMKSENGKGTWFDEIHTKVQKSAYEIIDLKGYTSWAVGLSVSSLAYSILHNVRTIHAVSTLVKGHHGIDKDVFLSLPCVLGDEGVTNIIKQPLTEEEMTKLRKSADEMLKIINGLDWSDKVVDDKKKTTERQ